MIPSRRKSTASLRTQQSVSRSATLDSAQPSLYSLGNNSSGTLMNSISKVEFTNVRPEEDPAASEKHSKPNKLKRFIHKVKKELDTESLHVKPELTVQTKFPTRHSSENKSPLARTFSKDDTRVSFSDRLRQLNSTKYKSYNYHNLIKNRTRAGSKAAEGDPRAEVFPLADTYVKNYTVQELEALINAHSLSFSDCDEYARDIYTSIKQLADPLFKGEKIKYTLEDMTKLVGIYVKLRLLQEIITESQLAEAAMGQSSSSSSISEAMTPSVPIGSAFAPASPVTPYMAASPVIRVQASIFGATKSIKEDFMELMKHSMTVMINQLYYDEFKKEIRFIRGTHPLLTKRRNTLSSFQQQPLYHHSSFSSSLYPEMAFSNGAQSSIDLPIMPSTRSVSTANSMVGMATVFPSQSTNTSQSSTSLHTLTNIGMLPLGTFERCNTILWDFFETHVLYELTAIFLPMELELAFEHQDVSKSRNRATRMKYGSTAQMAGTIPSKSSIVTYTNTTIHPDYFKTIDKTKNVTAHADMYMGDMYDDMDSKDQKDQFGVLGELSSVNIRKWILLAYRDYVVIPLYELNRNYEDVDGVINSLRLEDVSVIDEYYDACTLQRCFVALSSVDVSDTNQKLVENLLDQMKDRCRQLENGPL